MWFPLRGMSKTPTVIAESYQAGEGAGERYLQRGDDAEQADTTTAIGIAPVTNMGSWDGIGPAQTLDDRYEGAGLFL